MRSFGRQADRRDGEVAALLELLRSSSRLSDASDGAAVAQAVCDGVRATVGTPGADWQPGPERVEALRLFAEQAIMALDAAASFDRVRFLADHDSLTGLGNRRCFMDCLAGECSRSRRYARPFAVVLCDLDGLKQLNDRHGHQTGDAALLRLADVLRATLRVSDGAFRVGGDEFGLVLVEAGADEAADVVGRLRESLPVAEDTRLAGLGASFGVAVFERHDEVEELLRRADAAMYADKRTRRTLSS
ncbi:MAG: GGDEF domain-containing protein [Thermoleophilaceae bacterium]